MNSSSGIKRGLAATAISALAVAGLPFLASSASAATGQEIQFVSAGPTRDDISGNAIGGSVVLKTKNISQAQAQAGLQAIGTDLTSSANSPTQSIVVVAGSAVLVADAASNPNGGLDGFDEITVPVKVDNTTGATASYAIYLDDDVAGTNNDTVQSTEPRAQVTQATAGAPTSITVAPGTQTAPSGVQSGNYVGTVKDAAGRITQVLSAGEVTTIVTDADTNVQLAGNAPGGVGVDVGVPAATIAPTGTFTFKAEATTLTVHTIGIDGPGAADTNVNLDVVAAATGITPQEVDVVTGADDRAGFGNAGSTVAVRPDQASVKFDIASPTNNNKTVSVTAASGNVTFGGAASKVLTATLNASGIGSITVNVDAASIASGDSFTVMGSGLNFTVNYVAPVIAAAGLTSDAATYVSAYGGTVNPTISLVDQYGNPITGVFLTVDRTGGGANSADVESARKAVDAAGKATFALTDTSVGLPKNDDTLTVNVYSGPAFGVPLLTKNVATIKYTADGAGADFILTVDSQLPSGGAYDPNNLFANSLTDTTDDDLGDSGDESIAIGIAGGTAGAPVSVTVDGGALILKGTESRLSQGSATDTGVIGGAGFEIIGTKAGLVNLTVTSAGRTKTAQVSIHSLGQDIATAATAPVTARNLTVAGPAKAKAGDIVDFTVTVKDAFGNVVPNVLASAFSTLVTGSGQVVGNSGSTNAAGQTTFQVKIDASADSPVGLKVTGTPLATNDFGAAANRLTAASTTDDGLGLTVSSNVATATIDNVVNIAKLEKAVADAQDDVDAAVATRNAAIAQLKVAKAQLANANAALTAEKRDVRLAKKALKRAKASGNRVRIARARAHLRAEVRDVRAAQGDVNVAAAQVNAQQISVNNATAALVAALDALAAAQAELDAANA